MDLDKALTYLIRGWFACWGLLWVGMVGDTLRPFLRLLDAQWPWMLASALPALAAMFIRSSLRERR